MGVDDGGGNGSAGFQTRAGGHFLGDAAHGLAQRRDGEVHLFGNVIGKAGIQGLEKFLGGVAVLGVPGTLIAGGAGVFAQHARQLPDDPVAALHDVVGGLVDLRRLVKDLPGFGDLPLAGDLAAVAVEEGLAPLAGDLGEAVGVFFRGVMLPALHIGVGRGAELGQEAQGRAVGLDGQDGAGGEVRAHADDVRAVHAALL